MAEILTNPDDVVAALTDDGCVMPPVDPTATAGIAWLRATVARFCDGPTHARRRAYAVGLLAGIDPDDLRRHAYERTIEGHHDGREATVYVLASALGVHSTDLTPAVAAAALAYHPHTDGGREADAAVGTLVEAFGGVADEPTAARIGLLVQACEATAGLIDGTLEHGSVADALRRDPPVRRTRRVRNGSVIHLDLTAAPDLVFGAGPHRCPGSAHATAIAAGVTDALRRSSHFVTDA